MIVDEYYISKVKERLKRKWRGCERIIEEWLVIRSTCWKRIYKYISVGINWNHGVEARNNVKFFRRNDRKLLNLCSRKIQVVTINI